MMSLTGPVGAISRGRMWTGRVLSALPALLFLMNGAVSLSKPPFVVEGTQQIGFPESSIVPLGVVQLICAVLYLVPRTSLWGAILLTAYLGGAVSVHVAQGDPLASKTLVPVYFGVVIWTGLLLRDDRLRAMLFAPRAALHVPYDIDE